MTALVNRFSICLPEDRDGKRDAPPASQARNAPWTADREGMRIGKEGDDTGYS